MSQVYCQLTPSHEDEDETLIRFVLPISPDDTVADIKVRWGDIYPKVRRALAVAKADPEVAMHLPSDLPPSLGVQFSVKIALLEDPDVDLWRFLAPQLRAVVAGSVANADYQRRTQRGVWTPST